jgi:hypothetical protein
MVTDRDESGAEEITLEDKIQIVSDQSKVHLLVSAIFLPFLIAILIAGLLLLSNAHESTTIMVAKKPQTRAELFHKKIETVHSQVETQYSQFLNKMDDESIFTVSKKFEVIYDLSLESELANTELLESYQALAYETASRVRGSGEWYYYYEQKISRFIMLSKSREKKMKAYFEED